LRDGKNEGGQAAADIRTFMGGVFGKKKLLSDLQKKMSPIGPKWIGIEANGARGLFGEKKRPFPPTQRP